MKKHSLILFFLLITTTFAVAQQDTTTIFQRPRGYHIDPLRSEWNRKISQQNGLWVLSLYGKRNELREKISFEDKNLEIRKGPYVFYEDGNVLEEGEYDKGYKVGEWNYYYSNKQLAEKVVYSWDKLNGLFKSYWDNGQLKSDGVYLSEKKIGIWRTFYKNGSLAIKENHNEQGEVTAGIYFDKDKKALTHLSAIELPNYPGGVAAFEAYVKKAMRYPTYALRNKIKRTVLVSFVVNQDGKIEDVVALSNRNSSIDLDNEAIRLVKASGKWIPGKELGEIANLRSVIPIKFSFDN
ncbi:TonB family protein [Pedobacter sp. Hv1]|uniref:TonB family protein n=1 Tax=Pedobacter sp. Hv1 TaxID=1740090 RepID=UPI0006D8C589|nr:TonB family protein [Pedobacter sp. Hv1]KQB98870.1 hypothetical protein AQF98_21260 [Pedobacter sp. Hv1]